eukprot:4940785-Pleurochrysis_carterae.AAC.3
MTKHGFVTRLPCWTRNVLRSEAAVDEIGRTLRMLCVLCLAPRVRAQFAQPYASAENGCCCSSRVPFVAASAIRSCQRLRLQRGALSLSFERNTSLHYIRAISCHDPIPCGQIWLHVVCACE